MTAVQKRVMDLLKEIDEICMSEGIAYSLAGRTAAMCVSSGGFTCDEYQADIMMTPDAYKKFCSAVSGKPDRALESLETNPLMDGVYARYVDTATTLIDIKRGSMLRQKGVCVRIWVLRSKAAKSGYAKTLETIIRMGNVPDPGVRKEYSGKSDSRKLTFLAASRSLLRHKGTMKRYFSSCTADDGSSKNYFYYDGKDKIKVPRKSMGKLTRCTFEGTELSITADAEKLSAALLKGDALSKAEFPSEEWGVYYDMAHPFDQVIKEAKASGTDFDRLALEKFDYDEFSTRVYRKKLSQADKQYKYVWRTINRFRLLDEYDGKTDEISARYKSGGADAVREDLADYTEMIEAYADIGMGFAIDNELLNTAYAVMEEDGKGDIVGKAKKLLPEEYREDLADWLSAEGYSRKQSV